MSLSTSKREQFEQAFYRLQKSIQEYEQYPYLTSILDGIYRRFTITYEWAWKTMKVYTENLGISVSNLPKAVIKEAYANKLIKDESVWLMMMNDRNLTSHVYQAETAIEIVSRIENLYVQEFQHLLTRL